MLELIRCVCFGVLYMWEKGLAHGDVRPLNVIRYIDATGKVRFRVIDPENCDVATAESRRLDRWAILELFIPVIGRWNEVPQQHQAELARIVFLLWRMPDAFFTQEPTRGWFVSLIDVD